MTDRETLYDLPSRSLTIISPAAKNRIVGTVGCYSALMEEANSIAN